MEKSAVIQSLMSPTLHRKQHGLAKFDRSVAKEGYGKGREIVRAEPNAAPAKKNEVHIVKAGDTLYSISKQYSVSVDDLKRWNYIYSNTISVGQKLTVETEKFN